MKTRTKHFWTIIVLFIIANIAIFSFFSKRLESLVADYANKTETTDNLYED